MNNSINMTKLEQNRIKNNIKQDTSLEWYLNGNKQDSSLWRWLSHTLEDTEWEI